MNVTGQAFQQPWNTSWDVIVAGAGHAGLCAAISAAEQGCKVLVLDAAPIEMRGGNTRHTRNLRAMHEVPTDVLPEQYPYAEYFDDLLRVTKGNTNQALAAIALKQSEALVPWLQQRGVTFQPALEGTLNLGRTNAFFLGGGRTLLNALCRHALQLGIAFSYDTHVDSVLLKDNHCLGLKASHAKTAHTLSLKQLVVSSGGFEANLDWLAEGWGEAAKNFLVRGTPYNKGAMLQSLLEGHVKKVGELDQCHAVAIDARAPRFDGGIVSRLDAVPFSVVLNQQAERFYDEGEDMWPKRYAIWGRLVAGQPDQIAYAMVDSVGIQRFIPSVFEAIQADTIEGLADQLGLDPARAAAAVAAFNHACPPGDIDPTCLDGKSTSGLAIEKTNWAAPIAKPPFYAYPLRPGITFTYMGVAVDQHARILMDNDQPSDNMFAAGEVMAGNILGQGYLAGLGMTIGGVFGRIAGEEAAHAIKH